MTIMLNRKSETAKKVANWSFFCSSNKFNISLDIQAWNQLGEAIKTSSMHSQHSQARIQAKELQFFDFFFKHICYMQKYFNKRSLHIHPPIAFFAFSASSVQEAEEVTSRTEAAKIPSSLFWPQRVKGMQAFLEHYIFRTASATEEMYGLLESHIPSQAKYFHSGTCEQTGK